MELHPLPSFHGMFETFTQLIMQNAEDDNRDYYLAVL